MARTIVLLNPRRSVSVSGAPQISAFALARGPQGPPGPPGGGPLFTDTASGRRFQLTGVVLRNAGTDDEFLDPVWTEV